MAKLEYTDSSNKKHTLELSEVPDNTQSEKMAQFYIDHLKQHDVNIGK